MTIVAVPDPEEEVRTIVRSIAASDAPFHRIAVIHRQDNPYASLLRQELDFARIPYSGVTHRSLGDTQTGLLLLGLVDLAMELNGPRGAIDRAAAYRVDNVHTRALAKGTRRGRAFPCAQ